MTVYIGNSSGIAEEVKRIHVGIAGIAERGMKAYVGDANGIARQVFQYVADLVHFPAMTGYATPSGTVSDSTHYSSQYGWHAMDGNDSTYWCTANLNGDDSGTGRWVKYDFGYFINPVKAVVKSYSRGSYHQFVIEGSADDSTWVQLAEYTTAGTQFDGELSISTSASYRYYRYRSTYTGVGTGRIGAYVFDIYGYKQ